MTGIPDLGIWADIMDRVLEPLLCVFLAGIQSVGIGTCMNVCVWYTELTYIYRIGPLKQTFWWVRSSVCVSVCVCVYVCVSVCVCVCECLHACVCVVYRADLYTVLGL